MKLLNSKVLCLTVVLVALVIAGSGVASAQDVYKVNYFSNNITTVPDVSSQPLPPDGTVRIDNPGLTYGTLCAMIYVFDQDQQMTECCGCPETDNGLRTLSIRSDLTSNPLTGVVSRNGVIKVVSAAINGLPSDPCIPASDVSPTPNLRVWVTHIGNPLGPLVTDPFLNYPITETESSNSTLGSAELANLQAQCAFINILGSGAGVCSCGTGD